MRLPIPLPHRRHRTLPVPGLVLGAAMALTACGGSGFDTKFGDGAEAAEDSSGTSDRAATGGPGMADEEVILDFYQCLRDNGMDVEDPDLSGGQGVRIGGGPGGGAIDPNDPEQMTILEDCRDETGLGGPGGTQGGNFGDNLADPEALIDFASCMRENGVDWPDPTAEGAFQVPEGLDPSSPEVQAASEACRQHLSGGGVMVTR